MNCNRKISFGSVRDLLAIRDNYANCLPFPHTRHQRRLRRYFKLMNFRSFALESFAITFVRHALITTVQFKRSAFDEESL